MQKITKEQQESYIQDHLSDFKEGDAKVVRGVLKEDLTIRVARTDERWENGAPVTKMLDRSGGTEELFRKGDTILGVSWTGYGSKQLVMNFMVNNYDRWYSTTSNNGRGTSYVSTEKLMSVLEEVK